MNGGNGRKGNGLDAFTEMTRFYSRVSQTSLTALRKICAAPEKALKDEEIWAKLDKHREHMAFLMQLDKTITEVRETQYLTT